MNLLIVDDQAKVVQGLLKGIDWPAYGIDQVYGALSVAGALEIFQAHAIDVLLCDIEMPIANGLSLVQWVKEHGLDTQCILLTSHAKFEYAQQSVKLHVSDYILQPASYESIAAAVQNAVRKICAERTEKELTGLGETFTSQESAIVGGALWRWLSGQGNREEIAHYVSLGKLPDRAQPCVLALIQILRWTILDTWTPALLTVAFDNIAGELFSACVQQTLVTPVGTNNFALLVWGKDKMPDTVLRTQLSLLSNVCRQYFGFAVALYCAEELCPEQMLDSWERLNRMCSNNVARKSAVFYLDTQNQREEAPQAFNIPAIGLWKDQLHGDHPQLVEQEAFSLLDRLSAANRIDARTLHIFYQEFLLIFHSALGENHSFWHEVLADPQNFKIYCEAPRSVEQMKTFLHLAISCLAEHSATPQQDLMRRIDDYIDQHMEEEISRLDLAGQVFLNADYLNRLVRQITGCSLKEYVSRRKLNRARMLLLTTRLPVAIVASKVGYINAAHFSVAYKKQFGQSPMQTRSGKGRQES